jgi:hypothetical protein
MPELMHGLHTASYHAASLAHYSSRRGVLGTLRGRSADAPLLIITESRKNVICQRNWEPGYPALARPLPYRAVPY